MPERNYVDHSVQVAGSGEHVDRAALDGITAEWLKTTNALRETERRYRELVESSLGLICTHDLTGKLLSINPAASLSLGYKPGEGIGHNIREFLIPETRHLFDDYLQRIRENRHDAGLMRVRNREGGARVWMYRNVLTENPDGAPYVLGHAIDITERVVAERTLRESEQALRQAHGELEARVSERTFALERANERLRVEIAERERAEQLRERALIEQRDTLAFLATFSEGLAPVLTFDELIEVLHRLPAPFPGDWTSVRVLNEDGTSWSYPSDHIDRARHAVLTRLAASVGGSASAGSLVAAVIADEPAAVATSASRDLAARLVEPDGAGAVLQELRAGSAAVLPLAIDGRVRAVLFIVSGNPTRFTGAGALVVEDVARRIRLALDRIQLYREAQDANRLKDEFLSTLSHELRTPLNAIFGWARMLRKRDLDVKTAHGVIVIERNAEAQIRLIEEVLDVSRIMTGKMTLATESIDLRSVVRAAIDAQRPAMQAKKILLSECLGEELPPVVADADRLQQAFGNVLSNAVKFTGAGGAVTVNLRNADRVVEVEITDTGVGIRREVLPFVFDRFRQADSSTTRMHGGLGLGLAIVKHIIELHGGIVKAASAGEGRGSTFVMQLPVADRAVAVELPRSSQTPAARSDASLPLRERTVLVVEDHDDARELIGAVLEGAGARIVNAASTPEAVARAAETSPDLLIADIGLPGEDGYVLLRRLRALHGADLPAIALTAYARIADRERALAEGFQQHLVKPIDPRKLVEIVASTIRRQ